MERFGVLPGLYFDKFGGFQRPGWGGRWMRWLYANTASSSSSRLLNLSICTGLR